MTECKLQGWDGREYTLPALTESHFSYGRTLPCDSFWLKCPFLGGDLTPLERATRLVVTEDGRRRFSGVVDEYRYSRSCQGSVLELSGRGMAALLLDNEAPAMEYQTATQSDILRQHVTPYGIAVAPGAALPPVNGFVVAAGSSEWQVLYDFACYHGGVMPRFDRDGRLVLTKGGTGHTLQLDESVPVVAMECRGKRYGVLSQVLVRDKPSKTVETVTDSAFVNEGGRARRVMTMPGRSNYRAMRYSGAFQLKESARGRHQLKVTVPAAFFAQPGDGIQVTRRDWGCNGYWQVGEVETGVGAAGHYSTLTLYREGG